MPPQSAPNALPPRHTGQMSLDAAQLSSLTTALDELTERITVLADQLQTSPRQDVAADLFEVERNLRAASRRLHTLLSKT